MSSICQGAKAEVGGGGGGVEASTAALLLPGIILLLWLDSRTLKALNLQTADDQLVCCFK